MVFTKILYPPLVLVHPFLLILEKIVLPFKNKLQLIVPIEFEAEHAHEVEVKFVKMTKVGTLVLLDVVGHNIYHAERVKTQQVFNFYKINKVLKQGLLQRQLRLFKNIILIKWKEFADHSSLVFQK